MKPAATRFISWLVWAELGFCALAVVWLQVVGVVTETVVHHILHALPIAVLLPLPRSRAYRLTAALTGCAWIFMLAAMTPMIHHSIIEGYLLRYPELSYTWLAPSMAAISAIWMALNLTLLSGQPRQFGWFVLGSLALTPALALLHPLISAAFEKPLEATLQGHHLWALLLAIELPLVLALPWWLAVRLTAQRDIRFSVGTGLWQIGYWAFFFSCMVGGILPVFNR